MCNLKSPNFAVVMISGPCPLLTSVPPSIVQVLALFGSLNRHPVKSLPSNKVTGAPHFGAPVRFRAGARRPIQDQETPPELLAVPTSWRPTSFPLKVVSLSNPSSSLGDTNSISPILIWAFASGVGCSDTPTITTFTFPCSSETSIQE